MRGRLLVAGLAALASGCNEGVEALGPPLPEPPGESRDPDPGIPGDPTDPGRPPGDPPPEAGPPRYAAFSGERGGRTLGVLLDLRRDPPTPVALDLPFEPGRLHVAADGRALVLTGPNQPSSRSGTRLAWARIRAGGVGPWEVVTVAGASPQLAPAALAGSGDGLAVFAIEGASRYRGLLVETDGRGLSVVQVAGDGPYLGLFDRTGRRLAFGSYARRLHVYDRDRGVQASFPVDSGVGATWAGEELLLVFEGRLERRDFSSGAGPRLLPTPELGGPAGSLLYGASVSTDDRYVVIDVEAPDAEPRAHRTVVFDRERGQVLDPCPPAEGQLSAVRWLRDSTVVLVARNGESPIAIDVDGPRCAPTDVPAQPVSGRFNLFEPAPGIGIRVHASGTYAIDARSWPPTAERIAELSTYDADQAASEGGLLLEAVDGGFTLLRADGQRLRVDLGDLRLDGFGPRPRGVFDAEGHHLAVAIATPDGRAEVRWVDLRAERPSVDAAPVLVQFDAPRIGVGARLAVE